MKYAFFITLLATTALSTHMTVKDCRVLIDFVYYDLNDLALANKDYSVPNFYLNGDPSGMAYTLLFNFCSSNGNGIGNTLYTLPAGKCNQSVNPMAALLSSDQKTCIVLSNQTLSNTGYHMDCKKLT